MIQVQTEVFRHNSEGSVNGDQVLVGRLNLLNNTQVYSDPDDSKDTKDYKDDADSKENSTETPVKLPFMVTFEGSLCRPEGVGGAWGSQGLGSIPGQERSVTCKDHL